jgi:glycine cleavage system H protein
MALRRLAHTVTCQWGLRLQAAPAIVDFSFSRAFAAVAKDCKYASSHEWAKVEGSDATVGISAHASAELGDVVYVELPEVGSTVTKGEPFGVVESVKAASDVYAPVSGEVVATNSALADQSDLVNSDPHGEGWMLKIKVSDSSELDSLMDAAAYEKHIADAH